MRWPVWPRSWAYSALKIVNLVRFTSCTTRGRSIPVMAITSSMQVRAEIGRCLGAIQNASEPGLRRPRAFGTRTRRRAAAADR